jgi:hypothetical protein
MGINGKGSRAKIAHAVKRTCLSGCWNASVLGGLQDCIALPPRQQLSAILLCLSSCRDICENDREGEGPCWNVTHQLSHISFVPKFLKIRSLTSSLPLGKAHFGWYMAWYTNYLPCVTLHPSWRACDVYALPWPIYSYVTHCHHGPTYILWETESTQHLSGFGPLTRHSEGSATTTSSSVVLNHRTINTVTLKSHSELGSASWSGFTCNDQPHT